MSDVLTDNSQSSEGRYRLELDIWCAIAPIVAPITVAEDDQAPLEGTNGRWLKLEASTLMPSKRGDGGVPAQTRRRVIALRQRPWAGFSLTVLNHQEVIGDH